MNDFMRNDGVKEGRCIAWRFICMCLGGSGS